MDSLKLIKSKLFDTGDPSDQISLLLDALILVNDDVIFKFEQLRAEMSSGIDKMTKQAEMMKTSCPWRQGLCEERFQKTEEAIADKIETKATCFKTKEKDFVTRRQAYGVGLVIVLVCFALSIGISIGTGEVTKTQALKQVTEKLLP